MACLRHAISPAQALSAAKRASSLIEDWRMFQQATTVLLYHSLPDELSTVLCLEQFHGSKKILLPVIKGENIELCVYGGKESLCIGAYSILEPTGHSFTEYDRIDLCFIPGVAFDKEGNRLGRGKGYYDRLLPRIRAPKVGLCYECQFTECLPSEPHDVRMDYVITEERVLAVKKKD